MNISKNKVTVVLHGGLGNQLFQYYKAALYAHNSSSIIIINADLLGQYKAPHKIEIENLITNEISHGKTTLLPINKFCRLRIPKLITRLMFIEVVPVFPFYGAIIDGYFQKITDFSMYDPITREELLNRWRTVLKISDLFHERKKTILHIRLGDFFQNENKALSHAKDRIKAVIEDTDIVTDQEDLVIEAIKLVKPIFTIKVIPSKGFSGWEVLRLFCQYSKIDTNGSTLAFWASVLTKSDFRSSNCYHEELWRLLVLKKNQ